MRNWDGPMASSWLSDIDVSAIKKKEYVWSIGTYALKSRAYACTHARTRPSTQHTDSSVSFSGSSFSIFVICIQREKSCWTSKFRLKEIRKDEVILPTPIMNWQQPSGGCCWQPDFYLQSNQQKFRSNNGKSGNCTLHCLLFIFKTTSTLFTQILQI